MALLPSDPKKQQQIALGLIPVVLLVVFYQFVHAKAVTRADELESRVETLTTMNDAQRAIVARFGADLDKRIAIFQEHIAQLEQLIPRREDVPMLLNQVTETAQNHGVELVGYTPANEEAGDFYARHSYEVQVLGGYHDIGQYLSSIASLSRIVRPYEVKISVEEEPQGTEPPVLRSAFRIETFVLPVDTAAAPPAPATAGA